MNSARKGKLCRLASARLGKKRQAGFSLIQRTGIIFLVSVLSVLLYDQFLRYQARVAKTVMEMTVVNMRSGLRLRVAELMMQDRMKESVKLLQENPIHWLAAPPANYLGEFARPQQQTIPANHWYFDSGRRHELVYRLPRDPLLGTVPVRQKEVHFRVTAALSPRPNGQDHNGKVEGLALTMIDRQD